VSQDGRLNSYGKFEPASLHAVELQRLQIDNAARTTNTATMQRLLLDAIGLHAAPARYDELAIPAEARSAADRRLASAFPNGRPARLVGLFVGTSTKGAVKRWPPESWAALVERLTAAEMRAVVLAGPDERAETLPAVAALLPGDTPIITGAAIGEFLALVNHLDAVVTADTLALHAAAAQHISVVALVGPMPHNELELHAGDRLVGPRWTAGRVTYAARGRSPASA
jgi:ADP-heptose:LPS heptosyltransferase